MARDQATRGLRDEASVGPDPHRTRELKRLSELKYRVADGEPDIVGWTVFASTGRELGKVTDLLVDVEAGEVVMLDIDLRRGDQHTLTPVRAAWIDHTAKRVVLDARALEQQDAQLPGLPRSGALSDADLHRFNDDYVRAYGDRGVESQDSWRVQRGEEELRFGAAPRADRPPGAMGAAASAGAAAAASPREPYLDESRRIDSIMEGQPTRDASRSTARPLDADRRESRVDDASALGEEQALDPRELDARVRIDEGGTVDERAPVGGVRYEGTDHAPHDYGRPDERYGPEYGTGRIGFDRVVTRHPRADDDGPRRLMEADDRPRDRTPDPMPDSDARTDDRVVRYRRYDDPSSPR